MQLIHAVVEPSKVDEICEALQTFGFRGFTVLEAAGFGRRSGDVEIYRGTHYRSGFRHRAKIEIVVEDDDVHDTVEIICKVATRGQLGTGGKLWITPVSEVIRMRTREEDSDAL
jgi:nitrogen regulatory protein P-II 1